MPDETRCFADHGKGRSPLLCEIRATRLMARVCLPCRCVSSRARTGRVGHGVIYPASAQAVGLSVVRLCLETYRLRGLRELGRRDTRQRFGLTSQLPIRASRFSMRQLLRSILVTSMLAASCGTPTSTMNEPIDSTADAAACTGTAPLICDGCCGAKYAADSCVDGIWTCRATGGNACPLCDAAAGDSSASDASGDAAACTGAATEVQPQICTSCCPGLNYGADCVNGRWECALVICPRCDLFDAGVGDSAVYDASGDASSDASTCTGSAPLCFGNDATRCCGNDPAGSATCSNGQWLCGSAPAPGCNGVSCVLEGGP